MSNGALPKQQASCSSLSGHLNTQNSSSELFELKPKPKLFCIPENCTRFLNDLRKTQSLNVHKKVEHPEKSWSVLYFGSKSYDDEKKRFMM
ncbi:uncharacterized protein LOC119608621 [Lucilia sericata]|uniref:uncharacterized protein LOC119608621 n=1 Tax=Lucilia sericata TaxID=13632 RepID=UPI0018A7EBA0|nr:uncharacterized protein LOC119608621 [Lucilia sericata]